MDKIPLIYRHNFLGELVPREDGTGYYSYVWDHSFIENYAKIMSVDISNDIISDNNYDDTNKESEENEPFLKKLKKSIKH